MVKAYTLFIYNKSMKLEKGIALVDGQIKCHNNSFNMTPEIVGKPEVCNERNGDSYLIGFDSSLAAGGIFRDEHPIIAPDTTSLRFDEISELGYGLEGLKIEKYFNQKSIQPISCILKIECPIDPIIQDKIDDNVPDVYPISVSLRRPRPIEYYIEKNNIHMQSRTNLRNDEVSSKDIKSERLSELHNLFGIDSRSNTTDSFNTEPHGAFVMIPNKAHVNVPRYITCVVALTEGAFFELVINGRYKDENRSGYVVYNYRIRVQNGIPVVDDLNQVAKMLAR